MTEDLPLNEAKALFLNPSSKAIRDILEKERYPLRARSMERPLQSTWLDNDDSEDYDPSKERKQAKRKRAASDDGSGSRSVKKVAVSSAFVASLPMLLAGSDGIMDVDALKEGPLEQQNAVVERRNYTHESNDGSGGENGSEAGCTGSQTAPDCDKDGVGPCQEFNRHELEAISQGRSKDEAVEEPKRPNKETEGETGDQVMQESSKVPNRREGKGSQETDEESDDQATKGKTKGRESEVSTSDNDKPDDQEDAKAAKKTKDTAEGVKRATPGIDSSSPHNREEEANENIASEPSHGKGRSQDGSDGQHETDKGESQEKRAKEEDTEMKKATPAPEDDEVTTPTLNPKAMETKDSAIETQFIWTCFVHPITFDHLPGEDGSDPCHFCSDFAYGIVGLGKRRVEVVKLGGQYSEISGGHSQDGHPPSRMCVNCAQRRLRIVKCLNHQVTPLKEVTPESFDFKSAYDSLASGFGRRGRAQHAWCSVCPTPGFFQCRCGLVLCESCEILSKAYRGDLQQIAARNREDDPENGCRADVEYLLPGNELCKHYQGQHN